MKKLLEFLVNGITGTDEFTIEESVQENQVNFIVKTSPEFIGLVIGKSGKTIRAIRNILKVRAVLDKKAVYVSVTEE